MPCWRGIVDFCAIVKWHHAHLIMIDIVFAMHFISSLRINVVKLCHIRKYISQDESQFMLKRPYSMVRGGHHRIQRLRLQGNVD